ncbi:uncharacterized protein EV420DRAFT_1482325 [Desarmillaria tabescens]|uniref:HNH nuclease domain-containing protein n=1 Tax=Armillaria tabescens TaxID=1929756 RepID=A0AA39MZV7_ARMTA|nr:uncharacterized protein EV420DRAFT_1482325 [Desarmillaria tabescens]KAK0451985.1 hypothetical protein EV420DRAFT_1482325 [Desarmillaria tabescens]
MADSLQPRPSLAPHIDRVEPIAIFHPIRNAFLVLGRRQKILEAGVVQWGIPHSFVLDACLVLAGKGYLSSTSDHANKISTPMDGFLMGLRYFFFLEDDNVPTDYLLCTNFSDWEPLPRQDVPERWLMMDKLKTPSTGLEDMVLETSCNKICNHVKGIDKFCALSGFDQELRAVHLVPQAYVEWYNEHILHTYFTFGLPLDQRKARPIDDVCQIISLESGLHDCIDQPSFIIFPFCGKFVAFFFASSTIGLAEPYHLRTMKIPFRIEGYALFACFAWAITTITQHRPTQTPQKRRRKQESDRSASSSDQSPPSQRHRCEGDSHVSQPGDHGQSYHGGQSSEPGSSGPVDIELLKEQERELTPSQLRIFREAEGMSRVEEMKRQYLADHLTISVTGESTTRGD